MITRIEVDGFKSLRRFALDLDPFCALIGPNGVGKSNVLDALSLLSRIASSDLKTAFRGGRGLAREQLATIEQLRKEQDFGTVGRFDFAVEVLLINGGDAARGGPRQGVPELAATRLRHELTIELQVVQTGLVERLVVAHERLVALEEGSDPWIDRHPAFARLARYVEHREMLSHDASNLAIQDPSAVQSVRKGPETIKYVPQTATIAEPTNWARSPHLQAVSEELRRVRVIHLDPHRLREASDRAAPEMTAEGEHLATALASLPPESLAHVRVALAALLPGMRTVDIVPVGDMLQIEVEATDGRRFSSRVLSDGTLRVLGLAAVLEERRPGGLLAIEEPENGIHPSRIRDLVDLLREAASFTPDASDAAEAPRQVLITSHSPVVLATLMDRPEDVVVMDMVRQGTEPRRTRARRIAKPGDVDRGQRTVSVAEIERLLDRARLSGGGAGEP